MKYIRLGKTDLIVSRVAYGGIVSAAIDGERCAEACVAAFKN